MSGSWALVTGASSGIGKAIAAILASKGWSLLLVSNQQRALEETVAVIQKDFAVPCHLLCCDLATIEAANQVKQWTDSLNIEVTMLVNNAGMLLFSEVVEANAERRKAILQLHMNTPVHLCAIYGAGMKERRAGYILNVSSISAVMPYPGISLYGPTKTFIRYFTRALRSEMAMYDVAVTCLIPGATATGLYDPQKINIGLARRLGVMQTPEWVAEKAVKAVLQNKATCIPGLMNRLVVVLMPWIPEVVVRAIRKYTKVFDRGLSALG